MLLLPSFSRDGLQGSARTYESVDINNMTTSEPLLEHTLSVLRERDIAIAREELNPAFDDSTTGANSVRWTRDRLGPETLLSKEEIDLYGSIALYEMLRTEDI